MLPLFSDISLSEILKRIRFQKQRPANLLPFLFIAIFLTGCLSNQSYNKTPDEYVKAITDKGADGVSIELAIIEFDEFGTFWDRQQLEKTLSLIRKRNKESTQGIGVWVFTHGWQNNADPDRKNNNLTHFREDLRNIAKRFEEQGSIAPDHLVGIYIGWRGARTKVPLLREMSFWDRKRAAERVATYNIRETLLRITKATKRRVDSKLMLSGHSMGGMILGKTLGPSLTTLLMANEDEGFQASADVIVLENPAMDAMSTYQVIDYLKRAKAAVELRHEDGSVEPAPGPVMFSITSEADWVTRMAYPAGQALGNFRIKMRKDRDKDMPSQWELTTKTHGHVDYLISHHAWVDENGDIQLKRIPGAYNDTPFWIIRVSKDISASHGDTGNPRFLMLVEKIVELNQFYDTQIQTWIRATAPSEQF